MPLYIEGVWYNKYFTVHCVDSNNATHIQNHNSHHSTQRLFPYNRVCTTQGGPCLFHGLDDLLNNGMDTETPGRRISWTTERTMKNHPKADLLNNGTVTETNHKMVLLNNGTNIETARKTDLLNNGTDTETTRNTRTLIHVYVHKLTFIINIKLI
jgi:hypothetical protein